MASNFAYKNTRDFKFILKEWLPLQKVLDYPRYKDNYSVDDVDIILDTILRMTKDIIEPGSDSADQYGVKFEDGKVLIAPSIPPVYKKLQSEGWCASNVDKSEGAVVLPQVIMYPLWEMFSAANPALVPPFLCMCQGSSMLIQDFAPEDVKRKYLPKMFSGEYTGTMCLTEPQAGSDVGQLSTKAFPTNEPRIFNIKGQKIFISNGDNDFAENIVHLLLARVDGALPGTRGISLFIVPKYWINDDNSQVFNDVFATGIEEKMGQHANPTVTLSFGENNSCRGYLLGINPLEHEGKGNGMALMFNMMNEERLVTGVHSGGLIANAFYNARDYAKERVQGVSFTNSKKGRVPIIEHEDVKRALLRGKAIVEAIRAMTYKSYLDIEIAHWDPDPQERKKASDELAVNIPIIKGYSSEIGWDLIGTEAIQIYGGYGYVSDYPCEKLARDIKINTLYEGTTYIQSMDLIGRKWAMEKGAVFSRWIQAIKDFCEININTPGWEREFEQLGKAIKSYQEIQLCLAGFSKDKNKLGLIPTYAKRIMMATAQLYGGRLLLDQALLAEKKIRELGQDHYDFKFYQGKIMAARYFLLNVVPEVAGLAEIVKLADTSVLDIDIECFEY
ncbi:MAG: acyl-CoA dehydrogenase [Syntrophomonadaceae bacterium]|nr:acyl-CoA dehydrogenase [Syntrophomonadaceae bacterium]